MSYEDPSWNAVTGYYGLAKDAYPSLNPLSSGDLAVRTWTSRTMPNANAGSWWNVCWSAELRLFATVSSNGANRVRTSSDGVNWFEQLAGDALSSWTSICWSPQLRLFAAVATGGTNRVMTSSNGITWFIQTQGVPLNVWASICWAAEIGLFIATSHNGAERIMTSKDGITWVPTSQGVPLQIYNSICWSPQLRLAVAVAYDGVNQVIYSRDGTNWSRGVTPNSSSWRAICWSPELGLFVAVAQGGNNRVMTSIDGITWMGGITSAPVTELFSVVWSPQLKLFMATGFTNASVNRVMTSPDGIVWNVRFASAANQWWGSCWSPELGIFVAVATNGVDRVMTSSLKGRPPTSYNVFDSSFNRIDENGKWDFSNINVTTLTVNGATVNSDDRLKHNEVVITNGLTIIDRLTPKFYQKTQVLLDASYNGDLSSYAWNYEAGLIAQEVLQISDLSYVVGGGDYYEQKYIYNRQTNDLSANYFEPSANNYEVSNNYYQQSANNYEISYNLIAKAYNLNYNSVFVYGLAAIKELHTKVKAQESTILNQKNIISSLLARIQALEK
jgi:hypothetical protein